MRERPILFSGEMVRALQEGRKTQTRRAVKPQPASMLPLPTGREWPLVPLKAFPDITHTMRCPYGQPGDRLWVRETWRTTGNLDGMSPAAMAAHCVQEAGYKRPWAPIQYVADGERRNWSGYDIEREWGGVGKTRVSIHMPRWASRITLEITDVRVQRVQEISEEDAKAEGAKRICDCCGNSDRHEAHWVCEADYEPVVSYRVGFERLWNSINAARGYGLESNPWVWALTFKRVEESA